MSADWYKEVTKLGHAVIRKTRLSNAMGTPLALVVLIDIPCFVVYSITGTWFLLAIACLPILYFIRAFDFLMKNRPEMLRTEEHEERMLQIAAGLGQKGKEITEVKLESLPLVTDPKEINKPKEKRDKKHG